MIILIIGAMITISVIIFISLEMESKRIRQEIKKQEERNREIDRRFADCLEHGVPFRNRKYR